MKKGFSLIELIVVITIIAVMTVVATVSFGSTNKRSRDARRIADLEKIRIGLEMARQVGSTYPVSLDVLVSAGYMGALPVDPKTGLSSSYLYSHTNYTYTLDATVEDPSSSNQSDKVTYRVTNP